MSATMAITGNSRRSTVRTPHGIARKFIAATGAIIILAFTAGGGAAQDAPARTPSWEFLVSSGTVVPTGAQRDAIRRGGLSAAQLSYVAHPALAITATLGWARSRDITTAGDPKLDVFTYDLGAELRAPRQDVGGFTVKPFIGVGAGARSYNHRSLAVDATHNAAAYGSIGGELGVRRVRVRVEARDYITGFKPLVGEGATDTRNDVALLLGIRFAR